MRARTRPLALAAWGLLAGAGCRSASPQSETTLARNPAPTQRHVVVGDGRLVPPTSGPSVSVFETASDGSRKLFSHGLRMVEHPDGSIDLARDYLPLSRAPNALPLPPRLGGGYVFYTVSSGTTLLYRAATWTAELVPLAQLDGEVTRLVAGFDRLFFQRDRRSPWSAFELETGRAVDLAGLPAAPAYGAMAFADEWFGLVEVPFRGLVATFDAGASYRSVGLSASSLQAKNGEIEIETRAGRFTLSADGTLRPSAPAAPAESGEKPGTERTLPPGPLGPKPLEQAVLRGIALSETEALVAAGGALARVSLENGAVLDLAERAYSGNANCQGLPLGNGVGFLCAEQGGKTRLLSYVPPRQLSEFLSFDEARVVSSNGNGALAIRGSCRSGESPSGAYCVVPKRGAPYELAVEGDLGVERVVALDDGRAVVLIPPRLGAPGSLAVIDPNGPERRAALVFPKEPDSVVTGLLKHGLWMNGFQQEGASAIRGWIAGDGPLVGVRVDLHGKVSVGKVEHGGIERALVSGPHALLLGQSGAMVESNDGGFNFHAVELPAEPQLGRPRGSLVAPVNGCSTVGCAFGGFLRVGYGQAGVGDLPRAPIPKPVRLPSPGGGRWSLRCSRSNEVSAPALPSPSVVLERPGRQELASGPWLPFWEEDAPRRAAHDLGFDTGTENEQTQLRAYAWGPPAGDWSKVGHWQVRVADRHRVSGGTWSTAISRSPFGTAEIAADTFGYSPNGNITVFRALLEPEGRSALLSVTARGRNDLYLLEEGRAITALRFTGSIGSVNGWVRLSSGYYVGTLTDSRAYRIYRVVGGALELFAEYPDLPGVPLLPTLVRSVRGDGLGLWTKGPSWHVHPVDLETGAVGTPLELGAGTIARLPRACTGSEDGWLLDGPLGIEPYVDFGADSDGTSSRSFEVRLVASEGDSCVESLAAQGDVVSKGPAPVPASGVPLVLSDRGQQGRRWGFRCSN